MLDKNIKKHFGTWKAFASEQNEDPSNFKRKIFQNFERLNKWIEPAGIEIIMVLQKTKCDGKK